MNKIIGIILITGIIAMGSFLCYCDEMAGKYRLETVDGTVESVDAGGSTLVLQSGVETVFPVSRETKFVDDTYNGVEAYQIGLSAIEAGDVVAVEYYRDDGGVITTTKVTLKVR